MTNIAIIEELPKIIKKGEERFQEIANSSNTDYFLYEEIIAPKGLGDSHINQFYQGDNLYVMERLLKNGFKGKIDLIYIDPPFMTKSNQDGRVTINDGEEDHVIEHVAYKDSWEKGIVSYLNMLCPRLYLMRELLSQKGTIYVHLDYRAVHYVKILLDCIFGQDNFLNEIIWAYKSGGVSKKYYSRKHDNILVYTKSKDYIFNPQKEKSYNRGFKPYRFKGVEEYEDDLGWYTLVNLKDVWQIDMVGRTSGERVGYATQKPEKLLERIILTSSYENSIVADFFAGSGTTGIVAERLNRRWIMADKSMLSGVTVKKRLIEKASSYNVYRTCARDKEVGELKLKVESIKKIEGIYDIVIELNSYSVNLEHLDIRKKYIQKIKDIQNRCSLALIDLIALDIDYDGQVPRLSLYCTRNRKAGGFNLTLKDISLRDGQKMYLKYIDVFGREGFNVYEFTDGKVILCQER